MQAVALCSDVHALALDRAQEATPGVTQDPLNLV